MIPFKQLVKDFGLRRHGRHMCGRKPFFTPEGKIAFHFMARFLAMAELK